MEGEQDLDKQTPPTPSSYSPGSGEIEKEVQERSPGSPEEQEEEEEDRRSALPAPHGYSRTDTPQDGRWREEGMEERKGGRMEGRSPVRWMCTHTHAHISSAPVRGFPAACSLEERRS